MLEDRYGLPIGTTSAVARDAYVAGCDCVLSGEYGGDRHLAQALDADPAFALAHVALARAQFLAADIAKARQSVARARELAGHASARERSHVNALCLAIEGKPVDALAATRSHLAEYPRDVMVAAPAAGVFSLIGFSGRQERETEQVEMFEALRPHLEDDWWFQSFYAFALAEVGRAGAALELIERSLAARPGSAHGAHTKAHVLYELGDNRGALDFLEAWLPGYRRDGLMHCHVSWHLAIAALIEGDAARAWQVYRSQVHPGGAWGPALNVATDAPSFLWRAELAGQPRQRELWDETRAFAMTAFPKAGIGFVDVHKALACVAVDDRQAIATLVEELERRVAVSPMGDVVPRLAKAFAAYGRGDWAEAIAVFEPVLRETVRIGGSRAQRDFVQATLLAAYLKDGRVSEAQRLMAAQAERKPVIPVAGLA